jgi:hypothetical protein
VPGGHSRVKMPAGDLAVGGVTVPTDSML